MQFLHDRIIFRYDFQKGPQFEQYNYHYWQVITKKGKFCVENIFTLLKRIISKFCVIVPNSIFHIVDGAAKQRLRGKLLYHKSQMNNYYIKLPSFGCFITFHTDIFSHIFTEAQINRENILRKLKYLFNYFLILYNFKEFEQSVDIQYLKRNPTFVVIFLSFRTSERFNVIKGYLKYISINYFLQR